MTRQVDREVLVGFIEEAQSYLPAIEQGIGRFQADANCLDGLEVAHRHIHTIKGASSMVGLNGLSHMAYCVEETLEEVGAGHLDLRGETAVFIRQTMVKIELYLDEILSGKLNEEPLVTEVVHGFRRLHNLPTDGDADALAAVVAQLQKSAKIVNAEPEEFPADIEPLTATAPAVAPLDLADEALSIELLEAFQMEAEEHLHTIATLLATLDKEPERLELMGEIRRSVHTLKGGAGTVGFQALARLAHRMEDLLDMITAGEQALTEDVMGLLFASADGLEDLLTNEIEPETQEQLLGELFMQYAQLLADTAQAARPPHISAAAALVNLGEEKIIDLTEFTPAVQKTHAPKSKSAASPAGATGEMVRVPLDRLDELVRSVSELVITRTTFEQHMGRLTHIVDDLWHSFERLRQVSTTLETEYEVSALDGGKKLLGNSGLDVMPYGEGMTLLQHRSEFDALQLDRYTEFHLLSRELTETTSDLRTIGSELRHLIGDFDGVLSRQGRLSTEIQDKLMRTRMVPLASLATRLHRAVRVVAQKQGKLVDLVLEGENIELDKKVLEEMADPLLHILRNAVDHGIEPPELRQVMGKPERGEILIHAHYQGNQVVLEIKDNGSGLDLEMLRAKAVSSGYVSEAEAKHLSDDDLYGLIFMPGFSTAETVSEVSGRGVGLDVLKTAVHKLKGSIQVSTKPGEGTTFVVRLPMTLAVTRALLVRVQNERYALPLAAVQQIMRLERDELELFGQEKILHANGHVYPLLFLNEAVHLETADAETSPRLPIIILEAGEQQYALVVDEILEGREIVVKTLGTHLRQVHGLTGATLMGDGSIVLILNPAELAKEPAQKQKQWTPKPSLTEAHKTLNVMVVDDSVSVRRVVSSLIKNSGWNPLTAKDGLDALTQLQNARELPDVMVLDIEMPRMDGYELTATLKANPNYRHMPIVMLTSRASEKHRQKALGLGVSEYVVKPYQDETLRAIIGRLGSKAALKA